MHALNSWLKAVRADGLVLVRTRVAGPWGFAVQPRDAVVFHFVAEGRAFVRQSDAETMALQAGELVLLPRGSAHEVVHSPLGKAIQLETFLAKRDGVIDPDPKAVTLICGEFNMDQHLALPALRALPQAVSLRVGMEPGCSPLSDTLRLLRNEVETPNFGNQIVVRPAIVLVRLFHARLGRRCFSRSKRLVFCCAFDTHRAGSCAHARGTRTCVDTKGSRPSSWFVACRFRAQLQCIGGRATAQLSDALAHGHCCTVA
jgi:hypothetical protein